MEPVKIKTVSTVDAICAALENDILSLHFAPGAKITESDLALRYGVSRNTVREAVAHLLAQGLLTKITNKGVYVRKFTAEDIKEIFHLRAILELEAVKEILANQIDISGLYASVAELEAINRHDQWDNYVQADILFHKGLVAAANSPRLSRLYDTIITEVKLCVYQTRHYAPTPSGNNVTHRAILEAISLKDEACMKLLSTHIEHVTKRYCAGLIAMDNDQ